MTRNKKEDERYGYGKLKPRCMQWMNSIRWFVFWQCVINFVDGFMVYGVISVIIPALEKRYDLSSSKSGLISSANDFGAFVILIFVGYFGERRHKPRIMGIGISLLAFGSLLFSLPQFIGGRYAYTVSDSSNNTENVCNQKNTTVTAVSCSSTTMDIKDNYKTYYAMFIVGQMFLGIGAVPVYTIGLTYLDENCKQKLTSFYTGLIFASGSIGAAVGFVVGGNLLNIFVDADTLDVTTIPLTSSDPQWVGAWWIGIVIAVPAFILLSFPIHGYPRRLPGYKELQKERKSEAYDNNSEEITAQASFGKKFKDFPKSIQLLAKNPTFILVTLSSVCETLLVGGVTAFGSKIAQQLFNIDLATAGTVIGAISIPGAGGGMVFGGYMVKKLKLRLRGIIYFCCVCMCFAAVLAPSFLMTCPSQPVAGISTSYRLGDKIDLVSSCNIHCHCTTAGYEPICDLNKTVYFSPCHAGCTETILLNGTKSYADCSCISANKNVVVAVSGNCSEDCNWFYVFCGLLFFLLWFTFATMSPIVTATFRCVSQKQRSFAFAIQCLAARLLGTTPGPIFLGAIIDSSCDLWQDTCGKKGSCWIYRKYDLVTRLMTWWICVKIIGIVFLLFAAKLYKPCTESIEVKPAKSTMNEKQ